MTTTQPTTPLPVLQAEMLARLARGGDLELLQQLVRVLGEAQANGHVCIDLRAWTEEPLLPEEAPRADVQTIRRELLATELVAACGASAATPALPLVLDDEDRLYARRHHRAERTISSFVRERLAEPLRTTAAELRDALEALDLLPDDPGGEPDWQLAAVVAAATRSLTVLCGGPGTGKTTTVAKLMSVLLHNEPELRIAICAPTGKAAARLGEALQERASEQPDLATALHELEPRTLHRLLGYLPHDDAFRYGRDKQLPYDLVVVDEVSMVDPAILAQLCEAMPERARLVLVGDKDQLAAVAAGQVLGDLCDAARPEAGVGKDLAKLITDATGMAIDAQTDAAPIADATVALWKNHRFGRQPGIGAFATALMRRRPQDAMQSLEAGHDDLRHCTSDDEALTAIEPHLLQLLEAATGNDAETALATITHARVLTAQRLGPFGAVAWNQRIEARLSELGHRTDDTHYPGRPILITSNDHNNRIWNGDLGVTGRDEHGNAIVWLRDSTGQIRKLTPRRLPAHETAWAMTVHKSQGSEFDNVLLVLPDQPSPLLHASLVYTGITRAKKKAIVHCDLELLSQALAHWPARRSGLAAALRHS